MKFAGPEPEEPAAAFWQLIDLARTNEQAFRERIEALSQPELIELYWTHRDAADTLRESPYLDHAAPALSEDGVDDLAAWVVAQGRDFYRDVIKHPAKLPAEPPESFFNPRNEVAREYQRRYHDAVPFPEDDEE